MKKFLSVFITMLFLLVLILPAFAAPITIDDSQLTVEQKANLEAKKSEAKTNATIKVVSDYVGLGKEIGQAVDGSLGALTNRAEEFANTRVGNFTLWIVAYKVLGQDAIGLLNSFIRIIIGIPILIAGVLLWLYCYRRDFLTYSVLVSKIKDEKNYKVITPPANTKELTVSCKKGIYALILLGYIAIMLLVILA